MKIRNKNNFEMNQELYNLLNIMRKERNFNSEIYIKCKVEYIIEYFKKHNINTCIIGISGGIDSSLTLSILNEVNKIYKINIIPFVIPNLISKGVSNQKEATKDGKKIIKFFNLKPNIIKLDKITEKIFKQFKKLKINKKIDIWSIGQSIAYLRTCVLYSLTSITTFDNNRSIIIGTTNKDEGSYIGCFGKASDGMVDLQIISDLHKSEVKNLAKFLNIPEFFIERIPTGDLFDKKTDEELFGFSYDFLELFLNFENHLLKNEYISELSEDSKNIYNKLKENVEKMHNYNKHKYYVGSPAIHLDIMEASFKNGWNNKNFIIHNDKIECSHKPFNNLKELNNEIYSKFKIENTKIKINSNENFKLLNNFILNEEIDVLNDFINNKEIIPVGIDGYNENYKDGDKIGSYRMSFYEEHLSNLLFLRLKPYLNSIYEFNNLTTDNGNSKYWKPVGINPLFRVIRYSKDGFLIPHYDFPYAFDDNKRTLITMVIYLNDTEKNKGGKTRFFKDPQKNILIQNRNLNDKPELLNNTEILDSISPTKGQVLLFPHRLLHDSEKYIGNKNKTIIRTDIVFERVF